MAEEKLIPNHNSNTENPDPNYWQSFEELHNSNGILESHQHEFKDGVSDGIDTQGMSSLSRRKFLALLGASAALAGTACSDYRDKGAIVPYNNKPEEITLGKANYYASTCTSCGNACGTLIKTREGRPIKVDGNSDHPVSKGKICAQGQASIMSLYDPDRLKNPKKKIENRIVDYNWKDADTDIILDLISAGGSEIALLTEKITSPTYNKAIDEFVNAYPSTKVYSYELINEEIRNSAWKKCYGSGSFPFIKWNEAKVILSLDGDFLGESYNKVENTRLFAQGKDVMSKNFNRLYVAEGNPSITGMSADYRLRLRTDSQFNFIMSLIDALKSKAGINFPINTSTFSLKSFAAENKLNFKTLTNLVDDLASDKGKSIVYAGSHLPEKVHVAVNLLNDALGNNKLYQTYSTEHVVHPLSSWNELKSLTSKMNGGEVGIVIHLNTNPVYTLPADLNYKEALQNVSTVISLGELGNETSSLSHFTLPINHNLESWGDAKTRTGFYSLQQPVIAPLYDTRQKEAILLTWAKGFTEAYNEKLYHEFLMKNWENDVYSSSESALSFKEFWFTSLHDGVVIVNEISSSISSANYAALADVRKDNISDGSVLHLKESYKLKDGSFANNGWLQELPHAVSQITWDNCASISPVTAKELGVKNNDLIKINVDGRELTIPVYIQPGASDKNITIELGYGRSNSGTVGTGVGFNSNSLISTSNNLSPYCSTNVGIEKVGGTYQLVTAQTIYAFNEGIKKNLPEKRSIIRETTVKKYLKNPHIIHDKSEHKDYSVYKPHEYPGLKWGMAIDLNKCLGCGECVIACVAENNIPVVGKDQVAKGREMQWLRIDRYYSGSPEDPKINNQPMLCQHCDQAPCENVCPVVATTHSPDGLNQMIYNRCVGTRYCSNNCPYKVRRFNYFNFRDHFKDNYQESPVFALLQNPEVTVRSRGVMEKCTFCIQRISDARSEAIRENRELKGSDVKVACQEACSTEAIKFGDINDEAGEFHKYRNHELGYYVLEELNVKPNVTYLAKLRNTHSEEV